MLNSWQTKEAVDHAPTAIAYRALWITEAAGSVLLAFAIGILWTFHTHLLVRQMGTYDWIMENAAKKKKRQQDRDAKRKMVEEEKQQPVVVKNPTSVEGGGGSGAGDEAPSGSGQAGAVPGAVVELSSHVAV